MTLKPLINDRRQGEQSQVEEDTICLASMTMMKRLSVLLALLLACLPEATSKSPFRPPVALIYRDSRSLSPLHVHGGGGEEALESNSTSVVSRGGSTRTMVAEESTPEAELSVETPAVVTPVSFSNTTAAEEERARHFHTPTDAERRTAKRQAKKRHKQIAKKLKNRNNLNIRRKVMHAAFGLTFAALNHLIPRAKFVPGMAILSSATLMMELLRYRKGFGWMNDALHLVLGSSLRKHEMEGKFTGSFYFFTGVTLTAYLYPRNCATLGICQLALADPSASYFGRQTRHVYWSRIENGFFGFGRNKGILGFLGGALFCFPFNYRVLSLAAAKQVLGGGQAAVIVASLALGLAGALADLAVPTPALVLPKKILGVRVPPFHVDDNMVVPIFSGFACQKVFEALGWPVDMELARCLIV